MHFACGLHRISLQCHVPLAFRPPGGTLTQTPPLHIFHVTLQAALHEESMKAEFQGNICKRKMNEEIFLFINHTPAAQPNLSLRLPSLHKMD